MHSRLVWKRIWAVLSDFFVEVGCHKNLQVAMYSVDSLRQLATKFLERDELANYSFQNDFLKPFVIVMRLSKALEIRELIIRCHRLWHLPWQYLWHTSEASFKAILVPGARGKETGLSSFCVANERTFAPCAISFTQAVTRLPRLRLSHL